ncbi:MAG: ATP-binding protein [Patescibacteria group bacterium]
MYIRHLDTSIANHFTTYKQALILLGARQVGKTTILKRLFPQAYYLLLDNENTKKVLETYDLNTYRSILGRYKQIILDELHLLSDPGRAVKIIYDQIPHIQLIVTGSSSFHIKNKTGQSLAGRKIDYQLYPLTFSEYLVQTDVENTLNFQLLNQIISPSNNSHLFSPSEILDQVLLFGLYPEMVALPQNRPYLKNLANSVVFQDLLELNLIDNKTKAKELLKLLAYQIGNLINYSELSNKLAIDQRTVKRYIDIFEDSFILYRLYPYSKKSRGEIVKNPKIYFWDVGLRNAIIDNFDPIHLRPDGGALFENFLITEIKKILSYRNDSTTVHYWRTKSGSEVDLVLDYQHQLYACEIKLNKGTVSPAFVHRYPNASLRILTPKNFY